MAPVLMVASPEKECNGQDMVPMQELLEEQSWGWVLDSWVRRVVQ